MGLSPKNVQTIVKQMKANESKLYNKERIDHILEILKENGSISVNELAETFQVSGATIRTDLGKMSKAGLITRTHGGAIVNATVLREPLLTERVNADKKQKIADNALQFIHERDIILMDTGTTMVALAQALTQSDIKELTVFSNDLDVIRILEEKEHFSLYLFGGKVRNGFHYCCGPEMMNELTNYHFTTLFLASSAVHDFYGLTTENTDLAQVKTAMIQASEKVILLADSSKIGNIHLRKFASLSDIDVLIMDNNLTEEDKQNLCTLIKNVLLV